MKKRSYILITIILPLLVLMPGCDFTGEIFKTGVWVGIIIIIAILAVTALIFRIFTK